MSINLQKIKVNLAKVFCFWLACLALMASVVNLTGSVRVAAQSNGLGVTPKLSYTVKQGGQLSDTLYINNLNKTQTLTIRLSVVDFKALDESGAPDLLQTPNTPLTPWSLKPYISLPDFVVIGAGKSKLIPFTIKFPANVGAGSYYSAIEYATANGVSQQQVNIAASSATLIFVNVPGNASELLNLLQFGISDKGKFKSFLTKQPTTFAFRVQNKGNVSEAPAGSIVVKNFFGHVTRTISTANPQNELTLIGQTRRYEVCYPKDASKANDLNKPTNCRAMSLKPGRYTAEITLFYGQNGQPSRQINAVVVFWYLPIWFIIFLLIFLTVLAYGVLKVYRRFRTRRPRRYHRH